MQNSSRSEHSALMPLVPRALAQIRVRMVARKAARVMGSFVPWHARVHTSKKTRPQISAFELGRGGTGATADCQDFASGYTATAPHGLGTVRGGLRAPQVAKSHHPTSQPVNVAEARSSRWVSSALPPACIILRLVLNSFAEARARQPCELQSVGLGNSRRAVAVVKVLVPVVWP